MLVHSVCRALHTPDMHLFTIFLSFFFFVCYFASFPLFSAVGDGGVVVVVDYNAMASAGVHLTFLIYAHSSRRRHFFQNTRVCK